MKDPGMTSFASFRIPPPDQIFSLREDDLHSQAQSFLIDTWAKRPGPDISPGYLPRTPALSVTCDSGTAHLIVFSDSSVVVAYADTRIRVLPLVLSLGTSVSPSETDRPYLSAWGGTPCVIQGYDVLSLESARMRQDPQIAALPDTLESSLARWAGLVAHLPDIRAPWAAPDAPLEGVDPETRRPYAWPAALPYRGWTDSQEADLRTALHDIAHLCLLACPSLDHVLLTLAVGRADQTRLPAPTLRLRGAPRVPGLRGSPWVSGSHPDAEPLCALATHLLEDLTPIHDFRRLSLSPGPTPAAPGAPADHHRRSDTLRAGVQRGSCQLSGHARMRLAAQARSLVAPRDPARAQTILETL